MNPPHVDLREAVEAVFEADLRFIEFMALDAGDCPGAGMTRTNRDAVLVSRFVSSVMQGGKKSTAEGIVYDSLNMIQTKTGQDGLSVLKTAMNNVKPVLEVKSRRVGGANYQVPVEVRPDRRNALATRWIISFARGRADHTFAEKFANEVMAASRNEGEIGRAHV